VVRGWGRRLADLLKAFQIVLPPVKLGKRPRNQESFGVKKKNVMKNSDVFLRNASSRRGLSEWYRPLSMVPPCGRKKFLIGIGLQMFSRVA